MEGVFEKLLAETISRVKEWQSRLTNGQITNWDEYQKVLGHLQGLEELRDVIEITKKELINED